MARVLIVGCGCRGRELAGALAGQGHAVRGTTRDAARLPAFEAVGAEAAVADPGRLGTLLPLLRGVSVLCWLMGTAGGEAAQVGALHGERLEALLETLVDTHVRGAVYEAAGSVDAAELARGAGLTRAAGERHRMPVALIAEPPVDRERWLSAALAAVDSVLAA
jgi:nucleoside-diphosphate-sugar epimerase